MEKIQGMTPIQILITSQYKNNIHTRNLQYNLIQKLINNQPIDFNILPNLQTIISQKNNLMKLTISIIVLTLFISSAYSGIVPTSQIMLYPNTQSSPSLYLISFKTSINLIAHQYLLISMDWLSADINSFSCMLVNTTIAIRCTNLATPTFALGFSTATLLSSNSQLVLSKSLVIQLLNPLPANVNYVLEVGLLNLVQNIKKISPSLQFYCLSNNGLIHQQNLNFGPVTYKPPITNLLGVSIYTDIYNLALGVPGNLVTLKAQITITIPVITPLSSMFFVLQQPFQYSNSSYITVADAEQYATNPIPLNSKPVISFFSVLTPHIFYVAFNQSFIASRRFILMITQIKNPFFIASSNVSIYTANFNSLTPLEAFQSLFPLKTVTQNLALTLGLPFDMPMVGPCVFYRNVENYYQVKFYMPQDVPEGYAIKVYASENTILDGTGFVDFQSLNYTTVYDYFTDNYFIMRKMGPILQGSLITIIFKATKTAITNFYIDVYIDTESVISAGTASAYMFSGRVTAQSVDEDNFFSSIYSSVHNQPLRVESVMTGTEYLRLFIMATSTTPTSTGSFIQLYLSPEVQFAANFNNTADCRFSNSAGTAICTVTKTANYVKISFVSSASYASSNPNAFPMWTTRQLDIYNIRFPTPSSNKYPYHIYMQLFNSSAVNALTYIQAASFSILPLTNTLNVSLTQQGNVNTTNTFKYPGFIRFACTTPSEMDYLLQQNQIRVISIFSTYGMRGLTQYKNQDQYPCSSNQPITCIFRKGILANGNLAQSNRFSEIERIDIFFKTGSTQTTTKFQIIIPDGINVGAGGSYYIYYYMIGIYNKLTKVYTYKYRNSGFTRNPSWAVLTSTLSTAMNVTFQGKAGSYKTDVSVSVDSTSITTTGQYSYLVMSSAWSLFESTHASYTSTTLGLTNPQFYTLPELSPLSVYMGSNMYISVFPFKMTSALSSFTFTIDNFHLPYHYDLPNLYIYTISSSTYDVIKSNEFQMTNQGIFYSTYLKSLSISCVKNSLGVLNTRCSIVFQPQNPLKADGKLIFSFAGINVATNICSVYLLDGTKLQSSCSSTSDNKNVTISMVDSTSCYHYTPQNFTATVDGISIISTQISQSVTAYLTDSTGNYIIQHGTRILTTTVAVAQDIQIYEITYKYNSPLSANKMKIRFSLPRTTYPDERLGFIMGKDLSDVNLQVSRMKIVLTRADGVAVLGVYQLISSQYKVLFTFTDSSQLTATNYTMQIYGIMTPVSLQNGAFSIIYQRSFDKAYTLTNAIKTPFPTFQDRIISNISLQAYYNTQGYQQKLIFTLLNSETTVNSNMVWIINFPSYYNAQLFNYNPYCMIDTTPIYCYADPTTPYQLIIQNSPKIVVYGTSYTISIYRIASPRGKYANDYYRSYYLFIGVLESITAQAYIQTALLYPEQSIQSTINGIITVSDVVLNSLTNPAFSSVYAIFKIVCNVPITVGSYLYLIFPYQFDNFNNHPINFLFKVSGSILFSASATVTDRTLEITMTSAVATTTQFLIQFPSLPTPKVGCSVKMSQTIAYVTTSNKKSIYAASSIAGNSAPILTFTPDPRYISFNHNNAISITAGTYSQMIDITSSDGNAFLTNIVVNLTSSGFVFEPASVFLKLGDAKGQFRVGADSSLFPVSYFYQTVKSQQIYTYYTITTNNNIMVTNTPINVVIPSTISVPIGGCSIPFTIDILNPPLINVQIAFIYNNQVYNQSIFYPNSHTTKSTLSYTPQITKNIVSFCTSSNFAGLGLPTTFTTKFVFSRTNYKSYQFTPNENVTINIVPAVSPNSIPAVNVIMINQQKTFIDFNITPTLPGIVYYQLQLGGNKPAIDIIQHQVYLKNNEYTIESNNDFMTKMYTDDRDVRIGVSIRTASGVFTLRQGNMLPERYYTFCVYLQTFYNIITAPRCITINTQQWGQVMKAKLTFSSVLAPINLNKVLCYFAKSTNTQVIYAVDLEGNSCYNNAVSNLYYQYPGQTFTSQSSQTQIYLVTNPALTSDPSPTAFQNMFNGLGQLSPASLSSALSGFAINYLSASYQGSLYAISMTSNSNADNLAVSFDDPVYNQASSTITVSNVGLSSTGTIYFVLVLYKQVHIDGNNSYVKIRLNQSPNQQQILNCLNWQNLPAEGCARAVYSSRNQNIYFSNIQQNCMYMLYYMAASEYPLRPIVSSTIKSDSIVTFIHQKYLYMICWILVVMVFATY